MGDSLRSLGITLAVQILVSMALLTVPVLAPVAGQDLGVPGAWVGLYMSIAYCASILSSLSCGDLIRRHGAIRVSQMSLVACAVAAALAAGGTVPLFVASALLTGAAYGPVTPASSHLLARTTSPAAMSLVFSIKQTGVPLGGVAAGALIPILVVTAGWRPALLTVSAACLAMAVAAQAIRAEFDGDREPGRKIGFGSVSGPLRVVLQSPDLRRLAIMSIFFSSTQLCLVTYLVIHLSALGYTLVQAGLMLAIAQAAGAVGRIAWGAVADYLRKPVLVLAMIAAGMAAGSLAMAGFSAQWSVLAVALVCTVFGATAIGWNGVFLAEVARRATDGRAVEATGGALALTFIGSLIGPTLFSLALENGASFMLAFAILAMPALASAMRLWLWHRASAAREGVST